MSECKTCNFLLRQYAEAVIRIRELELELKEMDEAMEDEIELQRPLNADDVNEFLDITGGVNEELLGEADER